MKNLIIPLLFVFIIACDASGGSGAKHKKNKNNDDTETVTTDNGYTETTENSGDVKITVDTSTQTNNNVVTSSTPIIPGDDMSTILFYDGSAKRYDGQNLTKLFDCENLIKADKYYFNGLEVRTLDGKTKWSIPEKAIKAVFYNKKLFYYTENNNLYMCEIEGESELIATNQYSNHSVVLTENGIRFELYFYNDEGTPIDGQFVGFDNILKIEKIGTDYKKYYYNGSEFVLVGNGLYSNFVRWHSLKIGNKDYYTSGAIFNHDAMTLEEPVYSSTLKKYLDGSCFNQFIQPGKLQPHFIGIGVYNGKGYFLNAYDGKIYIFNPDENTLTTWIQIVSGIASEDRIASFALFDKTNAFITDENIIYFDGSKIQKVNIDTGVKTEIAEATNFKGYIE